MLSDKLTKELISFVALIVSGIAAVFSGLAYYDTHRATEHEVTARKELLVHGLTTRTLPDTDYTEYYLLLNNRGNRATILISAAITVAIQGEFPQLLELLPAPIKIAPGSSEVVELRVPQTLPRELAQPFARASNDLVALRLHAAWPDGQLYQCTFISDTPIPAEPNMPELTPFVGVVGAFGPDSPELKIQD
jgi:hypothetical protein